MKDGEILQYDLDLIEDKQRIKSVDETAAYYYKISPQLKIYLNYTMQLEHF